MAKGQKRSNREHKKPKQPKAKAMTPTSSFTPTLVKPAALASGKKR
jgi:hypothetical protein